MTYLKEMKVDHCCGECRLFGYEDVYGIGTCLRNEGLDRFDIMRFCDQPCCEEFEEEEDD